MERVKVEKFDVAYRVILQPGDMTRYDIIVTQTAFQKRVGEVGIAIVMEGKGSAFTVSENEIIESWKRMRDLPLKLQLDDYFVSWIGESLSKDTRNPWTQRAAIEAAGRILVRSQEGNNELNDLLEDGVR